MPVYDKVGGDLYQRQRMFVDVGNTAYQVERAFVKVGGSLYEVTDIGGGGIAYALLETGSATTGQTTLYTINLTTGVLTQVGTEQTIAGVSVVLGIGTFAIGSTAYALSETGATTGQTTLYTINLTTGVLTQVGTEQTIAGTRIYGIGTFAIGSTAYALLETGDTTGQTTLYTINLTTGVLTQVGTEQTIAFTNRIDSIGTFAVGNIAYALVDTGSTLTPQTTLYTINRTTGALTQVGTEQTIAGMDALGIGTFAVGNTAYALLETGDATGQTTLYTINRTTGALTQVGTEQAIAGTDSISGIGTFTV